MSDAGEGATGAANDGKTSIASRRKTGVANDDGVAAASRGRRRPVTVVGAGFSGLVTAFHLERAGFAVEIIEKDQQRGGLIDTRHTEYGMVETAANGLLSSADVEELFSELGLEAVAPSSKAARRRFIFRDGRPRLWPFPSVTSFPVLLRLLQAGTGYFISKQRLRPGEGESVRAWGTRAFGADFTMFVIEAALQGVYAGDPSRLSASLIFGRFFSASRAAKPRRGKKRGTVTSRQGMGELLTRLKDHLADRGVKFRFGEAYALPRSPVHPVVLAVGAAAAAELLAASDRERATRLANIEMLPLVAVTGFFREPLDARYDGFGCVFPPREQRPVLGVLFNSRIFPGRSRDEHLVSETWILGGALPPGRATVAKSDDEIIALICDERARCFGAVAGAPVSAHVVRWPQAIPHYTIELEEALRGFSSAGGNTFLIGNYLGDIGLARILTRAKALAAEMHEQGRWEAP